MTTVTVPLSSELVEHLDTLVAEHGSNRAAVMRKALERLAEEEAINAILQSQREIAGGKYSRRFT
jgi:predicted transcriptional regulator